MGLGATSRMAHLEKISLSHLQSILIFPNLGVTNGLSKIRSLCKFKLSLGITALKKGVLESRARQK